MSRQFIRTEHGFVDLEEISYVREKLNGRFEIGTATGILDSDSDFDQILVQHLPALDGIECLFFDAAAPGSYFTEPVVAFGRTTMGRLVPVTPSFMDGVFQDHAMQKAGSPQVFDEHVTYQNIGDWVLAHSNALKALNKAAG